MSERQRGIWIVREYAVELPKPLPKTLTPIFAGQSSRVLKDEEREMLCDGLDN
jgi:hypothetical protein